MEIICPFYHVLFLSLKFCFDSSGFSFSVIVITRKSGWICFSPSLTLSLVCHPPNMSSLCFRWRDIETLYDNATSLKMTSSSADDFTARRVSLRRGLQETTTTTFCRTKSVSTCNKRNETVFIIMSSNIVLHRCNRCTSDKSLTLPTLPIQKRNERCREVVWFHKGTEWKNLLWSSEMNSSQWLTLEGNLRGRKQNRKF